MTDPRRVEVVCGHCARSADDWQVADLRPGTLPALLMELGMATVPMQWHRDNHPGGPTSEEYQRVFRAYHEAHALVVCHPDFAAYAKERNG